MRNGSKSEEPRWAALVQHHHSLVDRKYTTGLTYNLYYACHPCNRTKWRHWPAPALFAKGIQLIDLCRDDFATHFREEPDGKWTALTDSGAYTSELLRLNRRHLVELRQILSRHHLPSHRHP